MHRKIKINIKPRYCLSLLSLVQRTQCCLQISRNNLNWLLLILSNNNLLLYCSEAVIGNNCFTDVIFVVTIQLNKATGLPIYPIFACHTFWKHCCNYFMMALVSNEISFTTSKLNLKSLLKLSIPFPYSLHSPCTCKYVWKLEHVVVLS